MRARRASEPAKSAVTNLRAIATTSTRHRQGEVVANLARRRGHEGHLDQTIRMLTKGGTQGVLVDARHCSTGFRPIVPADLVAWRQNLTERFGDLDAATRTARRTVLNSTFWAEQIRAMA